MGNYTEGARAGGCWVILRERTEKEGDGVRNSVCMCVYLHENSCVGVCSERVLPLSFQAATQEIRASDAASN